VTFLNKSNHVETTKAYTNHALNFQFLFHGKDPNIVVKLTGRKNHYGLQFIVLTTVVKTWNHWL